jgi:hypothetical protein
VSALSGHKLHPRACQQPDTLAVGAWTVVPAVTLETADKGRNKQPEL